MLYKTKIIAITGPSGAGKTTVAEKLAKQYEKCVHIDVDLVKHFIVTGFIYGPKSAGAAQWKLLGTNVGQLAKNFAMQGYLVIVNGYMEKSSRTEIDKFIEFSNKILLLPSVEENIKRDKGRTKEVRMGSKAVKTGQKYFRENGFYSDFKIFDTSDDSIEKTIQKIKSYINS